LGGGNLETAQDVSDKAIKIPSRRVQTLRYILNDFEANANGKSF
jgi:sulfite reductase (ferredoxin)